MLAEKFFRRESDEFIGFLLDVLIGKAKLHTDPLIAQELLNVIINESSYTLLNTALARSGKVEFLAKKQLYVDLEKGELHIGMCDEQALLNAALSGTPETGAVVRHTKHVFTFDKL
ncbi:MAG: hypothetical protein EOM41_08135 [Bacilli bacterium]|nr:hypothetical protein [Bacilli bacterium]